MLFHLTIQNYALIKHLDIDFSKGFTVITGETGAGKSILLGALNMILGKRADSRVLMDTQKKCIVEGTFSIEKDNLQTFFADHNLDFDTITILRREINTSGKSRAFINDTPVNLTTLKSLGEQLIDIHSQDQTSTLSDNDFQFNVVDSFAAINKEVKNYKQNYRTYTELHKRLSELIESEKKSAAEKDFLDFILQELEASNLKSNEQEIKENELEVIQHAEDIKSRLFNSVQLLGDFDNSVLENLQNIRNQLGEITQYSNDITDLLDRLNSVYIELVDIYEELERSEKDTVHDPQKAIEIKERLDLIYNLQSKHRVQSVEKLIDLKNEIADKLQNISSVGFNIEKLRKELTAKGENLSKEANKLSLKRRNVFHKIEKEIIQLIVLLGMPQGFFKIEHEHLKNLSINGIDKIKFVFNANKGGELQDLERVASGGEKSRLMLAVKSLISKQSLLPTIIFDEIDMGVSGAVADKVGNILKSLSNVMQVIAITHLPQIAGKGESHIKVYKQTDNKETQTFIRPLTQDERIIEIAAIMSGQDITASSVETAKQLLNN